MIYLDNAATTTMDPEVIEIVTRSMREDFANSGTVYRIGLDAKKKLDQAERTIRDALSLPDRFRVIFTSGGSESNNLFIKGLCFPDRKVACLGLEHPSVAMSVESLREFDNPPLSLLEHQECGRLKVESLACLPGHKVRLLCLSHVNNELGSVNHPPDIVSGLARHAPQTRLFLDGVQALGKLKLGSKTWHGVSGYSLSAHKIHGPKGIGLLAVDANLVLRPLIHGGKQQFGIRAGTLPVPLIVGLARSIELAVARQTETAIHILNLRRHLVAGLKALNERIPELGLRFNSSLDEDPRHQSPAIVNFSFAPVEGEVILHHLEEKDIFVGLGSACSAHSKAPSKILLGIGCTEQEARCSLRISFSRYNTKQEVEQFLQAFGEAYQALYPTFAGKLASQ